MCIFVFVCMLVHVSGSWPPSLICGDSCARITEPFYVQPIHRSMFLVIVNSWVLQFYYMHTCTMRVSSFLIQYMSMNNFRLYIYCTPCFTNKADYGWLSSKKSLRIAHVCRIYVITYVHKYKDYMCAVVSLHKVCRHSAILFNSELSFVFMTKAWKKRERAHDNICFMYLVTYLFSYACLIYGLCF